MAGIVQNGQKRLIFIVIPQIRMKIREKGKRGKNTRMDKSKENTLTYIDKYIYTHPQTYKHINTDTHIHIQHIMRYSSQRVLFDIMFESI